MNKITLRSYFASVMLLITCSAKAQYPSAYSADIDLGYFNGHVFATYSSPALSTGASNLHVADTLVGTLGGNDFIINFTNPSNLSVLESGNTTRGAAVYPYNYGAYVFTSTSNGPYVGTTPNYATLEYTGSPIPTGSSATTTFTQNLKPMDQMILADLGDGGEQVSTQFLDASGNPIAISSNIKVVHLTNDAATHSAPLTYPDNYTIAINAGTPVTSVNNEGWAFVMLANNVRSIRITQMGTMPSNSLASWSFTFSKGATDKGDAPASYGNPSVLPLGGLLRLGAHGGDTENGSMYSSDANGDNTNNSNDEDGVSTITSIANNGTHGQPISSYSTTVTASNRSGTNANLVAWIDWDGNGVFDNSEGASVQTLTTGSSDVAYTFTWNNVILNGANGNAGTYLRIIASTSSITAASAADSIALTGGIGEVEDYFVPFTSPLPVKWLSFDATTINNVTLLSWTTATEHNDKGFEIERSTDGYSWSAISFVPSLAEYGNSSMQLNYNFTDKMPVNNRNFYRLKQVDLDGNYAFSTIRSVWIGSANSVSIYPNPTNNQVTISGLKGSENIGVYDATGKLLMQQKAVKTSLTMLLDQLSNGVYYITITGQDNTVTSHKILKSN